MTRNYFSRHGGPYFRNNGFSQHKEEHVKIKEYIKPDPNPFYGLTIAFIVLILGIGIALVLVN